MAGLRLLCVIAFACTGCIPVTDFDPVGNAASVSASWTVDGAAPSEASCRELVRPFANAGSEPGLPRVRVSFLDSERAVPHSGLVFDCALGSFDTGENRVVAAGSWTVRLEAIDPAGRVIAVGPSGVYEATDGGELALMEAPFLSAIISARVAVDGAEPSAAACSELGVARIQLVFDAAGGAIANEDRELCSAGGIGTRVEPGASYTVRLRTLDAANMTLAETEPETIAVEAGEHVELGGGPIELREL